MFPLRASILAVLVSLALCQYDDYDYQPASQYGPSGANCAQECDCPINFPTAMYCDNRKLKFVPMVPTGIKYLYLQNNLIEELKAGIFDNVTDLRWLVLDNNQITNEKIAKGTIDKLDALEKLFFSYNQLTEPAVPPSKKLDEIKMMGNKLSKFPAGLLAGKDNLTVINLQENELTSDNIGGAFKGLKSLVCLDLTKNKLKKLPAGVPSGLEILYADFNEIDSISAGYLNKLPKLQYLRISHNNLLDSGIPAGVFNVTSLIELDLSFNKLQNIPEVSEMLEQLYLQANDISSEWLNLCSVTFSTSPSRFHPLLVSLSLCLNISPAVSLSLCLYRSFSLTQYKGHCTGNDNSIQIDITNKSYTKYISWWDMFKLTLIFD